MDRTMTVPAGRKGVHHVSSRSLIRQSGLLAIAAGAYMAVLPFVHPGDDVGTHSVAWVPVHLLYFAALMLAQIALVGIFARQFGRVGRLGLIGFLTAFFGTAMMLLEGREHLFSHDFGQGTPVGLWQLIAASLVFSVGYVMLGVSMVGANVLPRGAGILLAVGGPIVAFSPPIGIFAVLVVGQTLFGLGLAWAGYALWTGKGRDQAEG